MISRTYKYYACYILDKVMLSLLGSLSLMIPLRNGIPADTRELSVTIPFA